MLTRGHPKVYVAWYLKTYFHRRDVVAAVAQYHGEFQLPNASDLDAFASFSSYQVNLKDKFDWVLSDLFSLQDILEDTIFITKFKNL